MNPLVSIIVPCYNEQATIRLLLEAVLQQTYPRGRMEVVIADGLSTDRTREEVAAFQKEHPDLAIQVVDNPQKIIPAGLNVALATARGEIVVRLDGHCIPYPDYVARSVTDLEQGLGDNVGGVWEIRPGSAGWIAQAIAVTAAHPLGVGDALYRRQDSRAGEVETVPFGAFRRTLVEKVGRFDETLLTNEDYEFNVRIRLNGGRVWLDPAIRAVYFARANFSALARQYWRYGYWKLRMLRRYPATIRWRQALPPLFVLSLLGLAVLAPWWRLARLGLAAECALYGLALLLAGVQAAVRQKKPALVIGLPLGIAVMHFAWGSGFIWSLMSSLVKL